jgi:hypothetical protein
MNSDGTSRYHGQFIMESRCGEKPMACSLMPSQRRVVNAEGAGQGWELGPHPTHITDMQFRKIIL